MGAALNTGITLNVLKRLAEKELVESFINVRYVGLAQAMSPVFTSRLVLGVADAWTSSVWPLVVHPNPSVENIADAELTLQQRVEWRVAVVVIQVSTDDKGIGGRVVVRLDVKGSAFRAFSRRRVPANNFNIEAFPNLIKRS